MKKVSFLLLLAFYLFACSSKKNTPDISNVKVNLEVERFDKAFFEMDTLQVDKSMNEINVKFPGFLSPFLQSIYPADRPRVALLVQAHGRTGADTAVSAGDLLRSALVAR